MKEYKGIIFDLDGTLLDTIDDLADSANLALSSQGFPGFTVDEYKLKIGKGFRNLVESTLPAGADKDIGERVLAAFVETYDKKYMDKTQPYEGIAGMLKQLSEMGLKIAVNSNKRTSYSNILIKSFFSDIPFVEIYGEREGIPKKPDPAAALEIAKLMELAPEQVVFCGDSQTDIQTGVNAGMDTIGVLWGFRDYEELESNGATYIVKTPEEITAIMMRSGNV